MREIKTFQEKDYSELNEEGRELVLYIDNDSRLYRQKESIIKNLLRKIKSQKYDHTLAPKLWMYLVDEGARAYCKEFGCEVRMVFPKPTRMEVAQMYADTEYENIKDGEWAHLESQDKKKRKTEAGMIGGGLWSSYYGDIQISFDSHGMLIKAHDVGQFDFDALRVDAEASQDMALLDLMEGPLANGWEYVDPEMIGALTEAPIFTNDAGDYSELFWYPNYQIESPIDDFIADGQVYFTREVAENVKKHKKRVGEGVIDTFYGEDDRGRDVFVDPQPNGMWKVKIYSGTEVENEIRTDTVWYIDAFLTENGCKTIDWGEGPGPYSGDGMFTDLLRDLGFEVDFMEKKEGEVKEEVDEDDEHAQALVAWLKDTDYPEASVEEMEDIGQNEYEIFGNEYLVATDEEADDEFEEKQRQLIDDLGIDAYNRDFILYYVDNDRFMSDLKTDVWNWVESEPQSYSGFFNEGDLKDAVKNLIIEDGEASSMVWIENAGYDLDDYEDEADWVSDVEDHIDGTDVDDLLTVLKDAAELDDFVEEAVDEYLGQYTAVDWLEEMGYSGSELGEQLEAYIDWNEVIDAVRDADGRGLTLSPYNGAEEEIQYEGEWYFIYRLN